VRKIINGRMFDTETSRLLGTNGSRQLYQTESGFFFFCDLRTGGISVSDYQNARRWAKANLPGSVSEAHFSVPSAQDLVVPLEAEAHKKLRYFCDMNGVEAEELVNQLILAHLKK